MGGATAGGRKGMGAGAQAIAAVVLVGGVGGGLWGLGEVMGNTGGTGRGPAECTAERSTASAPQLSGGELCTALNRPDLPVLLGTPGEQALTASGGDGVFTPAGGGAKVVTPSATVQLATYQVKLSAAYNRLRAGQMATLLGGTAEKRTVLGRPATLYSDRAMAISLGASEGGQMAGPGPVTRSLVIAKNAKDTGGYFELVVWREDGRIPDDAALLRVAEQVLPTVPGWNRG
ncbi:DUF6215 domain-containing protein [Streptomyces sp. NPDC101118]|uniref:DUF6215 domain-containing protein n=1 Tax=Streptomyces sp. NPDC101118 TaxID=3366109 RepID=UPI00382F0628